MTLFLREGWVAGGENTPKIIFVQGKIAENKIRTDRKVKKKQFLQNVLSVYCSLVRKQYRARSKPWKNIPAQEMDRKKMQAKNIQPNPSPSLEKRKDILKIQRTPLRWRALANPAHKGLWDMCLYRSSVCSVWPVTINSSLDMEQGNGNCEIIVQNEHVSLEKSLRYAKKLFVHGGNISNWSRTKRKTTAGPEDEVGWFIYYLAVNCSYTKVIH